MTSGSMFANCDHIQHSNISAQLLVGPKPAAQGDSLKNQVAML